MTSLSFIYFKNRDLVLGEILVFFCFFARFLIKKVKKTA